MPLFICLEPSIFSPSQLTEYYEVIKYPMALEIVKRKLAMDSPEHYECLEDFVKDIRLIFKNCYEFNPVRVVLGLLEKDLAWLKSFFLFPVLFPF